MRILILAAALGVLLYAGFALAAGEAKQEEVPMDKMVGQAEATLGKMKQALPRALDKLEEVQKEKDIQKLNCVNEKLTTIKILLKIGETAFVELQVQVQKKNKDNAGREFEKVQIAGTKLQVVKTELEGCAGTITNEGESSLEVTENKDVVAKVDPTKNYNPDDMTPSTPTQIQGGADMPIQSPTRPPRASPFQ